MDNNLLISEEKLEKIIKEELGIAKEVIELTKIIEDKIDSFLIFINNNNNNKLYGETLNLKELRHAILNDCEYTYDMFIRKSSRAFVFLKQEYNNKQIKAIQTGFNKDLI